MNHYAFPAYSLPKAQRKTSLATDLANIHGPNYAPLKQSAPTFSVPKSKRPQLMNSTSNISPQKYNPQKPSKNAHKYTIPKSSHKQYVDSNPPPGWYAFDQNIIKQKITNFTVGQKYQSVLQPKNNYPGPGDYEVHPPSLLKSSSLKQSKFRTAKRFSEIKGDGPGVGDYNIMIEKKQKKRQTFGKQQKLQNKKQILPGPSDYPIVSQFQKHIQRQPGFTISGRHQKQQNDITKNTFAKYFQNPQTRLYNLPRSSKFTIGKSKRNFLGQSNTPGPADYINDNFKSKSVASWTIPQYGINQICYEKQMKPGPGRYQIQYKKSKGNTFSRSQSQPNICSDSPGVGRYQTEEVKKFKKGPLIGKGKRTSFVNLNSPGVGIYQINETRTKPNGTTISKAQRFSDKGSSAPGPGDYHIQSLIAYKTMRK